MTKIKIILNPVSGMGNGAKQLPAIREIFEKSGLEYNITVTEKVWDAAETAEKAAVEGYSGVVAAGGDGTNNEVINGLMAAKSSVEKLPVFWYSACWERK